MSDFADICRSDPVGDDAVEFDAETNSWTVKAKWGVEDFPGIPNKPFALAIARAIACAWGEGYMSVNMEETSGSRE